MSVGKLLCCTLSSHDAGCLVLLACMFFVPGQSGSRTQLGISVGTEGAEPKYANWR